MSKLKGQSPLTKKRFESLLRKSAQPVSEWTHDQVEKEISGNRPSDGCSDKCKNRDKTEDARDLQSD